MPQDAFHIKRIVDELHPLLQGGKVNRVSQVNKDELTLIIYTGKRTLKLILSTNASGARVCVSKTEKEPAPVAPNFCMLLRKHLQNAEILAVRQHDFERIVEIDFFCTTDFSQSTRTLHIELMGKYSNILLTEKGVILGALKTGSLEDNTKRILFAGAKYLYPDPQDKISPFDGAGIRSRLQNHLSTHAETLDEEGLALFIFDNVFGLALPTARELVRIAQSRLGGFDGLVSSPNLPIADFIGEFCVNEPSVPHLKRGKTGYVDFFAFAVEGGLPCETLHEAEDEFYTSKEGAKAFEQAKKKLENTVRALKKKQTKKLQETLERLAQADKADDLREKGELLTANLYRVEKGATSVTLENWYAPEGGEVKIALDGTLSPSQNAQRYFKNYNKFKRAKEILTPMLKSEQDELSYTDSLLSAVALSETETDLKEITLELIELGLVRAPKARVGGKKKEEPIPFREYAFEGFTILAGRNNLQNDRLLKLATENDVWLHAQKYHSSHVVIVTNGGQVRDEVIKFASEICAYYSDGRDGDKIPVDYCKRKFVKKPNKSKAGFVVYTDYKTALATPNPHKEFLV